MCVQCPLLSWKITTSLFTLSFIYYSLLLLNFYCFIIPQMFLSCLQFESSIIGACLTQAPRFFWNLCGIFSTDCGVHKGGPSIFCIVSIFRIGVSRSKILREGGSVSQSDSWRGKSMKSLA